MGLGKDFTFMNLGFPISKMSTLIHIYHLPHWKVVTFLSLSCLCMLKWKMIHTQELLPWIHHVLSLFEIVHLCRWNFFPHTSLHSLFTSIQCLDLSWLSCCHFFSICDIHKQEIPSERFRICQTWPERKSWIIFFQELRLVQMWFYMPNILFLRYALEQPQL